MNYNRRFIKDYSIIARPLSRQTGGRKQDKINWDDEAKEAFQNMKDALRDEALAYPQFNKNKYIIAVDASKYGCGAVLKQLQKGDDGVERERTIAYASKLFNTHQLKWSTTEKECFGILWSTTEAFHRYVYGTSFILRTDHRPLLNITHKKMANERLQRWSLKLQDYDMEVQHISGVKHVDADAISRLAYLKEVGEYSTNTININQLYNDTKYINHIKRIREEHNIQEIKQVNAISHAGYQKEIIISEQEKDEHLSHIKKYLLVEKEVMDTKFSKMNNVSNMEKTKKSQDQECLEKKNNPIKNKNYTPNIEGIIKKDGYFERLVVPASLQTELLKSHHDSPDMGHYGINMTQYKLRQKYYWFRMDEDIKKYVQSCIKCQTRNKSPFQKVRIPITLTHDLLKLLLQKINKRKQ
eukprot:Awhi_evm3s1195